MTHINLHLYFHSIQAQRQDSVIGGAEINFGEAQEVYLCEFERDTGAREIYSSVDQTKKVKTKKKKVFVQSFMKYGVSPQKLQKYEW